MVKTGIGIIDLDGDYDTTYTTYISDLSAEEIEAIINDSPIYKDMILNYYSASELEYIGVDHLFFEGEEEEEI